jgi:hypothetical protein
MADDAQTDGLGRPLEGAEAEILAAYEHLKRLVARRDLPPHAAAGTREALASLWQVVHGLFLTEERPSV